MVEGSGRVFDTPAMKFPLQLVVDIFVTDNVEITTRAPNAEV